MSENEFLLIGGCRDGLPRPVDRAHNHVVVLCPTPPMFASSGPAPSADISRVSDKDVYTRRQFYTQTGIVEVFAEKSLSDEQVLRSLIENYRPMAKRVGI